MRSVDQHVRAGAQRDIAGNGLTTLSVPRIAEYTTEGYLEARRSHDGGRGLQTLLDAAFAAGGAAPPSVRVQRAVAATTAAVYGGVEPHFRWELSSARTLGFRPQINSRQVDNADNSIMPGTASHQTNTTLLDSLATSHNIARMPPGDGL